jgi:predicted DNA-binding transcriptional regulator AlpA
MTELKNGRALGQLPAEGFVRVEQLLEIFPFSKASLRRRIADHSWPAPTFIGRTRVWPVATIRKFIESHNG